MNCGSHVPMGGVARTDREGGFFLLGGEEDGPAGGIDSSVVVHGNGRGIVDPAC